MTMTPHGLRWCGVKPTRGSISLCICEHVLFQVLEAGTLALAPRWSSREAVFSLQSWPLRTSPRAAATTMVSAAARLLPSGGG